MEKLDRNSIWKPNTFYLLCGMILINKKISNMKEMDVGHFYRKMERERQTMSNRMRKTKSKVR